MAPEHGQRQHAPHGHQQNRDARDARRGNVVLVVLGQPPAESYCELNPRQHYVSRDDRARVY